ncbi:MAG: glycosyl hydrolase 53 family protein [Bacteroidetes bacterium]|nr:glycosyl hydrolase 53 family protein [Bacteroidota bacterium]
MRFIFILLIAATTGCGKNSGGGGNPTPPPSTVDTPKPTADTPIFKGADVSWITQMEASNYKFYNSSGVQQECMQLLQSLGMNSIRLRVWVNPSDGWCSTADLIAKAVRAKALGMRIMIDFHYSDVWADPAHQTKPAAWTSYDFTTLTNTVNTYTKTVLDSLKAHGVVPSWVQIGNETNDGMLWPDGRASTNMANFAALVSSGARAVKAVNDSIKVIVHISNGYNNSLFRWMFDGLQANNTQYDIIGMSLYPTASNWSSYNDSCFANMKDMVTRYNKSVMITEVGMAADQPAACQSFLTDLIHKVKAVPNGKGLGVFYWEPEAYNWQGYGLGAFDNSGKPTAALNAFHN